MAPVSAFLDARHHVVAAKFQRAAATADTRLNVCGCRAVPPARRGWLCLEAPPSVLSSRCGSACVYVGH